VDGSYPPSAVLFECPSHYSAATRVAGVWDKGPDKAACSLNQSLERLFSLTIKPAPAYSAFRVYHVELLSPPDK
jgi:hypothetical protein